MSGSGGHGAVSARSALSAFYPVVVVVLLIAPSVLGMVSVARAPSPGPTYDSSWAAQFQDALAYSTLHKDQLVAPLVAGAGMVGRAASVVLAYEEGLAWAERDMRSADRALLDARVRSVVLSATGALPLFTRTSQVPAAFVAPTATLLGAMLRAPSNDVLADGSFLLGVVDGVLPALRVAAATAPEEPILVDPVGLVIIGGGGDDTYLPPTGPLRWLTPVLVVEPGGNDDYHVGVASTPLFETDATGPLEMRGNAVGIDIAGSDRYWTYAASSRSGVGSLVLLVDEAGDDSYGDVALSQAVASGAPGFAYLADKSGNDAYFTRDRGLAYAQGGANIVVDGAITGVAVLADFEGDDKYEASLERAQNDRYTHAAAVNVGALAVLRDYQGSDRHVSGGKGYAYANDDGDSLFVDDSGDDSYFALFSGLVTWGRKSVEEGGTANAPTGKSLAYFLDGRGQDMFGTPFDPPPAGSVANDLPRVAADDRWGIFVDCETPPGARFPCEHEQADVLVEILSTAV